MVQVLEAKDTFVMQPGDSGCRARVQMANRLGFAEPQLKATGLEAL